MTNTRQSRNAFTLIELLVVIAIIAVLAALTTAAVVTLLSKGPETQTVAELRQFDIALTNFKLKFGMYPPSKIRLLESGATTGPGPFYNVAGNALDRDSVNFLRRAWQNIAFPPSPPPTGIDWNGDGDTTDDFTLEGDQCLVFFLGGIQTASPPGCLGFSTSPKNPAMLTGDRIQPFFEFKANRLFTRTAIPFFSYRDFFSDPTYPVPIAYFSSGKKANDYWYNQFDCWGLSLRPYSETAVPTPSPPPPPLGPPPAGTRYHNPTTFQIIYAGPDAGKKDAAAGWPFGAGGQWNANNPALNGGAGFGFDNFTNFTPGRLGTGN